MTAPRAPAGASRKSKTVATWLAFALGSLGMHRFYLHGPRDLWAWLHPWPTLAGLYGLWRLQQFGTDDRLAWVLVPVLGFMLAGTMLMAIVYGLMPDERWDARHNAGRPSPPSGWPAIVGVILALMVGATALMAAIAFTGDRYFESQIEAAHEISQ
jgi:glycerol uptake facilitator-like aquaporin